MLLLLRLLLIASLVSFPKPVAAKTEEIPSYAKWGRIAMEETQKRYPQAAIMDYLHVGRETLQANQTRETFKLWLKQDQKEWGVQVLITFDSRTEKIISIHFKDG